MLEKVAILTQHNDNNASQNLTLIEKELGRLSKGLLSHFHDASTQARLLLSPDELFNWAKEGLALARYSPPSSLEAAAGYFQATPEVLDILPFPRFLDWAHGGRTLCHHCPSLATTYFQASSRTLTMLPHKLLEVWVEIGRSLYRNTPESTELARSFFAATPELLPSLNLAKIEQLTLFVNRLAETSPNLAAECLHLAPQVLARIGQEERQPFLSLALTLVRTNPEGSTNYFIKGAEVLARIDRRQQRTFLSLTEKIARNSTRRALSFFFDCSHALHGIDSSLHSLLLLRGETLMAISNTAVIEFLKSCPTMLVKLRISGLEHWFKEGISILQQDQKAGLAYFHLKSVDERTLKRLSARVELEKVSRILLMYSQALTGTRVQISSTQGLKDQGMGWMQPDAPTTDGTTIFVPLSMDMYDSEEENFTWYKVAVTHQAGHIEFGTFNFSFEKEAGLFTNRRCQLPAIDKAGLTDMEQFFNLFNDRKLATDIFTVVEDTRIDYLLKQEYAGIRGSYRQIQQEALSTRPPPFSLPLREVFLEILIQMSLDSEPRVIPIILQGRIQSAIQILRCVQSPEATVEDTAEATLRLYEIISTIPNKRPTTGQWEMGNLSETGFITVDISPSREDWEDIAPGPDIELPYQSPTQVKFRGSFNPEMVQLLLKLKENPDSVEPSSTPLSPELLKMLAGKEIKLSGVVRGEHPSSGLYITDLPAGAQAQQTPSDTHHKSSRKPGTVRLEKETPEDEEEQSFFYDEWDFQSCCYLPKWCRVREKPLAEGSENFFEETLTRNSLLAAQIRKQFEMLAPELRKKLNKLHDGEELDLNAVIEAVVDRKAGYTPNEKIYWKRRKIQRDVAAIFLLDMSSSTAEAIKDIDDEDSYFDWYFERMDNLSRLKVSYAEGPAKNTRRVIDVAKESVVLMINALEATGDCYGIYGFSGHGRENVELLVIKGLDEKFSRIVERRIDKIAPLRSTRMGPAIRHASKKLEAHEAKTKILFLVSDGYPQDKGYGRDNNDKEYALHDTKMALIEAKQKNITPFCLTIDIAGYDYLKNMSYDIDYEVITDIESLPQRLPILYKKLTS